MVVCVGSSSPTPARHALPAGLKDSILADAAASLPPVAMASLAATEIVWPCLPAQWPDAQQDSTAVEMYVCPSVGPATPASLAIRFAMQPQGNAEKGHALMSLAPMLEILAKMECALESMTLSAV